MAFAGALLGCWRQASAAARHWVWLLAVASLLCLPWWPMMAPAWTKPVWTVSTGLTSGNQITLTLNLASSPGNEVSPPVPLLSKPGAGTYADAAAPKRLPRLAAQLSASWLVWAPVIWFTGMTLVLAYAAVGRVQLRSIRQRSRPISSGEWTTLLQELCRELNIRRPVRLAQSEDPLIPMTWGWLRPVVLLPSGAEEWPQERRRIVLLHELAHVRRWDCFTQTIATIVCALYWFNPVVWLAARRMSVERERACDDLVLHGGCKPSDYASHLVEIARTFRRVPQAAAIAMARSPQLHQRIAAIVDGSRTRGLRPVIALSMAGAIAGFVVCVGGCKIETTQRGQNEADSLRQQQVARLQVFSAAKEQQSRAYAARDGDAFHPDFQRFFKAAVRGDGVTVTNLYDDFKKRHGQYENSRNDLPHTSCWSPVLEVALAYWDVMAGEPKYVQLAIDGILGSIPDGSIYIGGTDPGRGLPTAFSKSQIDGDPFFTVTQNALADGTYLEYLRRTYGGKIYTPTAEDSQRCFSEYLADAERRLKENKLKPGEDVKTVGSKMHVSGQVAVMAINALLAKTIFDQNPDRQFYIEESFPLDWMYPHLSPNGLIMKINREPLPELSEEVLRKDREYWGGLVAGMLGQWLAEDTPVQTLADFAARVYARNDLQGFRGDSRFIGNQYPQKLFAKFRSSIAGVYAWRIDKAASPEEKQRMIREADFAFRQAFALCPYSPEAVHRYVNLLIQQRRFADAALIAGAASQVVPKDKAFQNLKNEIERLKTSQQK
ncbi:MAG: M56 family metallopeptidase [Verrucomicrobia bacterium]|nr:M56 family metallopeptidase [Verrucomicrobiota bacterium]